MLMATYICFTICFFTDLIIILNSASPLSQVMSPCYSASSQSQLYFFDFGHVGFLFPCYNANTSSSYAYQSLTFLYQSPTTTYSLAATQTNFTGLVNWTTGSTYDVCLPVSLSYDIVMWTCQNPQGCGGKFETINSENSNDAAFWHFSYRDIGININTNMCDLKKADTFTWNFIYPSLLNEVYTPSNLCTYLSIYLSIINIC